MNALKIFCILLGYVSLTHAQEVNDTSIKVNNLYVIRFAGNDTVNYLSFYGLSIAGIHDNKVATFSGLAFNFGMGNRPLQGTAKDSISINGINFSLFITSITGSINGFSFGGFWGNEAYEVNGISTGLLGTFSNNLNGISIGGFISSSKFANAIQVAGIMNLYCQFNGIGIASYNRESIDLCGGSNINGIILGIYNNLSVNGLSIGLVNNGTSWLQIGLVNMGDSTVQIGLVNLDENKKMGIPLININL